MFKTHSHTHWRSWDGADWLNLDCGCQLVPASWVGWRPAPARGCRCPCWQTRTSRTCSWQTPGPGWAEWRSESTTLLPLYHLPSDIMIINPSYVLYYIFHWFLASLGFDRIQCLFGLPMIFIFPWCTVHPCLYPKKAFCKLKQKINWSEIFFSCEQIFLNDCFAIKIYLIKRLFVNVIWSKLIFNNI